MSGLIVDPETATVYASSYYDGRFFMSADRGRTWRGVDVAPTNAGLFTLDHRVPTTLYASNAHALFKSTDGGMTWGALAGIGYVNTIAIDPLTPSTLYAGTWFFGGHIYRSTNGGRSWSDVFQTPFEGGIIALAVDPQLPTTLYAGTTSGLFKSTDGGTSWNVTGLSGGGIYALAIDPVVPTTLYASRTDYGRNPRRLFKSTDGGSSWTRSYSGLPKTRLVSALVVDPQAPATLYAGLSDGGVYRSADGGGSWAALNDGLTTLAITTLAIDPRDPTALYAGTDGGGVFGITITPRLTLTVDRAGEGLGTVTVTSTPSGITCGPDCSESYPDGATVTLTATAELGMVSGWTGCDTDSGPGLTSTCTLGMNAARSVTASILTVPRILVGLGFPTTVSNRLRDR